ncbi:MAG: hypothetical protein WB608_20720 [Terracidiphilus sp.]
MPREIKPPFKFKIDELVRRLRKMPVSLDGISIVLPFVEVSVKVDDTEKKVAREVVIRLADRRVLNSWECCDGCIDHALKSLQKIRQIIVDKQVELSSKTDGALYILLDSIREGIRQFLTFEQRLERMSQRDRQLYFNALEMLRAHIYRSLLQIAKIGAMEIPSNAAAMRYDENWFLDAYMKSSLPQASA